MVSFRRLSVVLVIPVLALLTPTALSAAGPVSLTYDPSASPADPAADAGKRSDLAGFLAASPLAIGSTSGVVAPMTPCPLIVGTTCTPAAPKYLAFSQYYQKTNDYCLSASIQSVFRPLWY